MNQEAIRKKLDRKAKRVNACWIWTGYRNDEGYGEMRMNKKRYKLHRLSYELFNGAIPEKALVCHSCDNPSCIEPTHLFLGNDKINSDDKIKKGRFRNGPIKKRLTIDEVCAIRKDYSQGIESQVKLASKYQVHKRHIRRIINNYCWKDNEASRDIPTGG